MACTTWMLLCRYLIVSLCHGPAYCTMYLLCTNFIVSWCHGPAYCTIYLLFTNVIVPWCHALTCCSLYLLCVNVIVFYVMNLHLVQCIYYLEMKLYLNVMDLHIIKMYYNKWILASVPWFYGLVYCTMDLSYANGIVFLYHKSWFCRIHFNFEPLTRRTRSAIVVPSPRFWLS